MPVYIVVQIKVNDAAAYERYKELAPPVIAAYGGRYLLRGGSVETQGPSFDPATIATR